MSMGILDFSTQSSNQSYTSTVTSTDSNNRSSATNSVNDNVGNVTVNLGAGGQETTLDKYLPLVGLGLLAAALFLK